MSALPIQTFQRDSFPTFPSPALVKVNWSLCSSPATREPCRTRLEFQGKQLPAFQVKIQTFLRGEWDFGHAKSWEKQPEKAWIGGTGWEEPEVETGNDGRKKECWKKFLWGTRLEFQGKWLPALQVKIQPFLQRKWDFGVTKNWEKVQNGWDRVGRA